ncbi:NAD-dependent epimerase/dehydratase family protein [Brucella sp. RRSP16]|uniref:NAD-dependent epimerase/dehydratase family protein n=1 Tax=Brucella sp. RRSP16 TaxID=3453707 RepID=UPI003FCDF33F
MNKSTSVLVVGGSGFIGSALVKRLQVAGYIVRGMSRNVPSELVNLPRVEWIQGAFEDEHTIARALEGIDVCFHLASSTVPKTANADPKADILTNLIGTVSLLEHATRLGLRRLVFASSGGTVYGPPQTIPISENHPTAPITSYGITKSTIEQYLHLFHRRDGLDYMIMRLSNPYGPGQKVGREQGVIAAFTHHILNDMPIELWGDGSVVRDFVYIDDAITGLMSVLDYEGGERIFNIGSGKGTSLNELIKYIERFTGKGADIRRVSAGNLDVDVNILDIKRAQEELNYEPLIGIESGIQRTIDYMRGC